ncbi:MAG: nickel pincer cofactor biosynthesis protein LarB [Haloarculaceae archaeon]
MDDDTDLEALLGEVAAGELAPGEAADRLRDVGRVGNVGRVDTRRAERTGIPEVVEAERKATDDLRGIAEELLAGTGRAILTGLDDGARAALADLDAAADVEWFDRSRTLVCRAADYEPPAAGGTVGVVTAGTSDVPVAERAALLADEMGPSVETLYDVGVSGVRRLLAELDTLRKCDAVVVAAGREGALATVVAGLVAAPVIGLPVGTGTGPGGDGEAALLGMLQSCTYLTVVNVDAGFVAGGQAALIAR